MLRKQLWDVLAVTVIQWPLIKWPGKSLRKPGFYQITNVSNLRVSRSRNRQQRMMTALSFFFLFSFSTVSDDCLKHILGAIIPVDLMGLSIKLPEWKQRSDTAATEVKASSGVTRLLLSIVIPLWSSKSLDHRIGASHFQHSLTALASYAFLFMSLLAAATALLPSIIMRQLHLTSLTQLHF